MVDPSVSRFRDNYIEKTRHYDIHTNVVRWYVRHAEVYIKTHAKRRLVSHSAEDLETYLRTKGRNPRLPEDGYDVRAVQQLLGQCDVKIRMIVAQVLQLWSSTARIPLYRASLAICSG